MNDVAEKPPERRSGFFVAVVPALLYVFAIFYGGLQPKSPGLRVRYGDKLMHALAFGFMQLVVLRAVRFLAPAWPLRRQLALSFVVVVAAGGALELAQLWFTTTRTAELADFVADAIGAGLMALGIERFMRERAPAP